MMKKFMAVSIIFSLGAARAQSIQPYDVIRILANDMNLVKAGSDYCSWQNVTNYKIWGGKTSGKIFYGTYAFTMDFGEDYARSKVDRTMSSYGIKSIASWESSYGYGREYSAKETPNYIYEVNIKNQDSGQYSADSYICFSVFGFKSTPPTRTLTNQAVVNDGPVKFRVSPSTNAKILFSLPKGAVVQLRGACGANWCPVRYGSSVGHMMKKYLNRY